MGREGGGPPNYCINHSVIAIHLQEFLPHANHSENGAKRSNINTSSMTAWRRGGVPDEETKGFTVKLN